MFEFVEGNLLDAKVDALVNPVNTEGVMGKGIALQFKETFPQMFEAYRLACETGDVKTGQMHVFALGEAGPPRFIINFPTKRHWRSLSSMEDIDAGLSALAREIRERRIQSIAIPALGCGNGGLDWKYVWPRMEAALGPLRGVRMLVYPPKT